MLGLNIFHKIHRQETRPLVRQCMPKFDTDKKHQLRSNGGYSLYKLTGAKFKKSFFPYFSQLWNNLPKEIHDYSEMKDFKSYTNKELKPPRYKHFLKVINTVILS